jgi:uncharacterized membrane protein YkoI
MLKMLMLLATVMMAGLIWTGCANCAADDEASVSLAAGTRASVAGAQSDEDDEAGDEAADDDGEEEEEGGEWSITMDHVPANVLAAAQAAVPGAEFTSAEFEIENGKVLYSLAGTVGGERVEVELAADGRVLEVERG